MVQNLKEILYFFESKGIYWFDLVGNSETFLQFEIETEKNEKVYPILKKQVLREMDFAFLLLQCEKYDEAENYLINLNKLIDGKDENYYLNVHRDIIVSLLFQLKNSDYISIKKLIIGNIQKSLQNLDLQKIVPFQIDKVYIPQYLEVEVKHIDINPIPGDRGVGHYHTILDGNIVMFQSLRKLLQDEFTLLEISDLRFALKCNEKASFHFVLSDLISISEEMSEVSQRYTKKGIDLSHLNEQKTRIEFWCDYDYRDDVNLYDIRDKIIKIIHEHLSKYVYIPWRFQFVS